LKSSDRYFVEGVRCSLDGAPLRVANLSVGGLFAATENPPLAGQLVELQLALLDNEPFRITAKVTWVNDPDDPRAPHLPQGFGAKITRISLPDKVAILDLLKRTQQPARRPWPV
jgi:Tfp pilus assembly protein PilZ